VIGAFLGVKVLGSDHDKGLIIKVLTEGGASKTVLSAYIPRLASGHLA
jgi:hypothetical protein